MTEKDLDLAYSAALAMIRQIDDDEYRAVCN